MNDTTTAKHDCGLCDGPLAYDGTTGGYDTWVCTDPECGWWHISKDCCEVQS